MARYGSLSENSPHDVDVELGVTHTGEGEGEGGGAGLGPQESGVMNLEQEVDNWDENAVDNWDSDDAGDDTAAAAAHGRSGSETAEHGDQKPLPSLPAGEDAGQKKRSD